MPHHPIHCDRLRHHIGQPLRHSRRCQQRCHAWPSIVEDRPLKIRARDFHHPRYQPKEVLQKQREHAPHVHHHQVSVVEHDARAASARTVGTPAPARTRYASPVPVSASGRSVGPGIVALSNTSCRAKYVGQPSSGPVSLVVGNPCARHGSADRTRDVTFAPDPFPRCVSPRAREFSGGPETRPQAWEVTFRFRQEILILRQLVNRGHGSGPMAWREFQTSSFGKGRRRSVDPQGHWAHASAHVWRAPDCRSEQRGGSVPARLPGLDRMMSALKAGVSVLIRWKRPERL